MHFRNRLRFVVFMDASVIIILEWLIYFATPLFWPSLSPPVDAIKILIVGDPQLLGDYSTGKHIFGLITRWDSDRFVRKTHNLAAQHLHPDVTIFLGDNLDEGEESSDIEFSKYFQRFVSVFSTVDFNKAIIIPGDNDIGGEHSKPEESRIERFESYFKNEVFIKYKFLEFVKVNYLTEDNSYLSVPPVPPGAIRVILSHVPLTPTFSNFVIKVLPYVRPHLILSAHEHISVHLVAERKSGIHLHSFDPFAKDGLQKINVTDSYTHEIMVPTCSYRMGTQATGYGALVIEQDGTVTYAVLWLPCRLFHLFIYIALLIFSILVLYPFPLWFLQHIKYGSEPYISRQLRRR